MMSEKSIREYASLMKELELSGLEITEGNKTIRLERHLPKPDPVMLSSAPAVVPTDNAVAPKSTGPSASGSPITSPMVGVFYTSPTEDAPPFVAVGDRVKKGDVLCIIEAMKLMNEITAERDGVIAEVCVTNGSSVEYGTVLFRMED